MRSSRESRTTEESAAGTSDPFPRSGACTNTRYTREGRQMDLHGFGFVPGRLRNSHSSPADVWCARGVGCATKTSNSNPLQPGIERQAGSYAGVKLIVNGLGVRYTAKRRGAGRRFEPQGDVGCNWMRFPFLGTISFTKEGNGLEEGKGSGMRSRGDEGDDRTRANLDLAQITAVPATVEMPGMQSYRGRCVSVNERKFEGCRVLDGELRPPDTNPIQFKLFQIDPQSETAASLPSRVQVDFGSIPQSHTIGHRGTVQTVLRPEVPGIRQILENSRSEATPGQFNLSPHAMASEQSSCTASQIPSTELTHHLMTIDIFGPQVIGRTVPVAQCIGMLGLEASQVTYLRVRQNNTTIELVETSERGHVAIREPAAPGNGKRARSRRNPDNAEAISDPDAASGMSHLDPRRTGCGFPSGQKLQFNFIGTMPTVRGGVQRAGSTVHISVVYIPA
ncbi:hypothetical protein C8R47DRAFT_1066229 [Mycena vitilis]|nr:hypothetical protein C8R47DRAFT_1066229 [Mycena vitilis]